MSDDTAPVRPVRVWYKSLYWRIARGFIAYLAVLLVAQALLFLVLAGRTGGLFPATSNARLAELIASDLREELERNAALDIAARISSEYGRVVQPFAVVLVDGRVIGNRAGVPPGVLRNARLVLRRMAFGRFGPPPPRRAAQPDTGTSFSPVVANGSLIGVVAVPQGPPPIFGALRVLGPTMALTGVILLGIGAVAAAALIFGPVRRRLGDLETVAERIGSGDTTARAPEEGGDEVAALAAALNRMAADLHARAEALASSDAARRQLLADVSHELMTPLTAMRGYLETLAMPEFNLDAQTRERYVAIVDEETRRLEHIVGDLLDLARLEGGGTVLRHEPVPIESLFTRVAQRHDRELRERRITLTRQVDEGAAEIVGDPVRLEQALQNLAANALRHTPDGGTMALQASPDGKRVRITVRDSGPGIAPEHLPLIFGRFYKVDAARASGGSGLGLSIVKGIVEAHGGTVSARNEDGAVFEIVLPRDSSPESARSG
jgi:signal transduction histidine kinase